MGLRQDVAGTNVKDETGEKSQVDYQEIGRYCKERCRYRSQNRRQSSGRYHPDSSRPTARAAETEIGYIKPVGEPVTYNSYRYRDSKRIADLECQSDTHAVQKAMTDQRAGAGQSHILVGVGGVTAFVGMVYQYRFFNDVKREEAGRQSYHRPDDS